MRVKVGAVWYDPGDYPIAVELTESDKQNISSMSSEATLYAETAPHHFDNDKAFSNWMRRGTDKENSDISVVVERIDE